MSKYDFVIFGGGLAGIWMHHQLSKHGKCLVIDNLKNQKSSLVAGGIYNPLMLNYNKKAFKADLIYPFLEDYYSEIELKINSKIIYPTKIKYVLNSNENLNNWSAEIENLSKFCQFTNQLNSQIIAPFGAIEVFFSGWVDVKLMIEKYHFFLENNDEIIYIENNNLDIFKKDFIQSKFIYSTGIFSSQFRHFLKPAKGEVLIIKSDFKEIENIYQQGVFLLPIGDGLYKVGSNFEWKNLNSEPSKEAKTEILNKLIKFLKCEFEIVEHLAGIRPSSLDRRPILGKLSENEFIFNGLGSKGVALAPFYSQMLAQHIVFGKEIEKIVSVERF